VVSIKVDISVGELVDKISILEIKQEHIDDPDKLANVSNELGILNDEFLHNVPKSDDLDVLKDRLKAVNLEIWNLEDDIRDQERRRDFGEKFVQLARSVYKTNDKRAALKREINVLLGSAIVEEKSYQEY
tara:strand:+ start:426 stop:815 length:390 start_codon:yes stop_codon:yes gene_type:complete